MRSLFSVSAFLVLGGVGAAVQGGIDPQPRWKVCDPATVTSVPPDSGWDNGGCVGTCKPYCRGFLEEYAIKPGECVPSTEVSTCTMSGTFTAVAFKYKCRGSVDPECPSGSQMNCAWGLIANSGTYVSVPSCY